MRFRSCSALIMFLAILYSQTLSAHTLVVAAASSLEDALNAIGRQYEAENPGTKIVFNFAGSSILARQIVAGAKIDMFFSADAALMTQLHGQGLTEPAVKLLSNRLVLVTSANRSDLDDINDLSSSKVKKIGIGHEAVPVGHYAMSYLNNQKHLPGVASKLVLADNVKVIAAQVSSKVVDVGFIYRTDFELNRKQLKLLHAIDPKLHEEIIYPVAILKKSSYKREAQKFTQYLSTRPALTVFKSFDFITLN